MLAELRADFRWLAAGFLLTFCSGFGQTYFIALFAGHLKADLGLSEGGFGGLYTAGTLASAALLMWAGRLADDLPIRRLGVGVMAGLALVSLASLVLVVIASKVGFNWASISISVISCRNIVTAASSNRKAQRCRFRLSFCGTRRRRKSETKSPIEPTSVRVLT